MASFSGPTLHFPTGLGCGGRLSGFYSENQWAKILLLSQAICIVGAFKTVPLFIGALTVFPFSAVVPARGIEKSRDVGFTWSHFEGFM